MKKQPLTDRQQAVLDYIKAFTRRNKYPPTRKEVAVEMSVNTNAISDHIKAIEKKGHIQVTKNIARGIVVL